jgi:O-antigen/teichoic acid export membrane protein
MIIAQSTLKTLLVIALVVLGLGTAGAVIGYIVAYLFAGLVGVLLIWTVYKKLPKPVTTRLEIKAYWIELLQFGIPLSFSAILTMT